MHSVAHAPTTKTRRLNERRVLILQSILSIILLIIVARLIEIQIIRFTEFRAQAEAQHFGDIRLAVSRGEIFARDSKSGELSILATNSTLNLLYIDPHEVSDPKHIAETLANILITDSVYNNCANGSNECPRELRSYFTVAFDPLAQISLEQELPQSESGAIAPVVVLPLHIQSDQITDKTEVIRQFSQNLEEKITQKRVTYVPLVYGANNEQIQAVKALNIAGITVDEVNRLIYGNPEETNPLRLPSIAKTLSPIITVDEESLQYMLRQRPLRYVPVMRRLPMDISQTIQDSLRLSAEQTLEKRKIDNDYTDPLRGIVLLPESWREYPDDSIASQVLGFTNEVGEPQYGVERTFNPQLRGKEGRIRTASDRTGLQIITNEQTVEAAEDGDSIVLTIDRVIQEKVEEIMMADLASYQARTGQAIVMNPQNGKILAMVNVPTFNPNSYTDVYAKEPIYISKEEQDKNVLVELYHPISNAAVVKASQQTLFTEEGRKELSTEKQQQIVEIEKLYNINDLVRYYLYTGEVERYEVFPTDNPAIWFRYKNKIGVGAYLNRTIQEIYEPGSVAKSITMAIALDQGEVDPSDTYNDNGPIEVDEFTINNALFRHYGVVNMTNCLEQSINTCMTMVSEKLGRKLFHRVLTNFGFGHATGIELEDELPGELRPWRQWSRSELATHAFGQGISSTPLQVITAFSALGNGGKLFKPTIIDSVIHADGTVSEQAPIIVDQVIRPETSQTITAMLTSVVSRGQGKNARVTGHKIAGKSGTSQIAGPSGRYEKGDGTTHATFAGYAPIHHPQFTILVKFDRPRSSQFSDATATITFRKIAEFLFEYYEIPPDL